MMYSFIFSNFHMILSVKLINLVPEKWELSSQISQRFWYTRSRSIIAKTYCFFEPKTWIYLIMIFMTAYDKMDAIIEEIVVDSTGEYSNCRSWIMRMNLVMLFTISKIELANSILIRICLNFWKFNFPVSLFVYLCLLSRWKRIAKIVL